MTTPSKIPSREWLLGWFEGRYAVFCEEHGINPNPCPGIQRKSREELWKDLLKITGQEEGA